MIRLCVTGGRDFKDRTKVYETLDGIQKEQGISVLIHGGATGADSIAADWARENRVPMEEFAVTREDWQLLGKKAGPLRNGLMLRKGRPDMLVAFEGGTGTLNCVGQASGMKIEVRVVA